MRRTNSSLDPKRWHQPRAERDDLPTLFSGLAELPNGVVVPLAAVELVHDLQLRGVRLRLDADGFAIEPPPLTADDRRQLEELRPHVLAVLACCK